MKTSSYIKKMKTGDIVVTKLYLVPGMQYVLYVEDENDGGRIKWDTGRVRVDGATDGRTDGQQDGRTDRQTYEYDMYRRKY